jgi:uncharacterized protein YodC (DUF2158 family)
MKLKIGDVVRLNSGGPKMTVEKLNCGDEYMEVRCTWMVGGEHRYAFFRPEMLHRVRR